MDSAAFYSALAAKDPRFDGLFFVGVTSTGIYCRPVCTARTPRPENCRFFATAEAAEKARFRPCLRCRPELAPGAAPVDDASRIGAAVARRIEEGLPDGESDLETIAAEFEISSRQLRRIVHRQFGVSPMELVMTRRLLLAKRLLTETRLSVTAVAFASGFASLRRFHDAFGRHYGIAPTRLRREATENAPAAPAESLTLRLAYRPPYDWQSLVRFLADRALRGVEDVEGGRYRRTVRLGEHVGWISARHAEAGRVVSVEISPGLTPALPAVLGRLRRLFDLDARPDVIASHLATDPRLTATVRDNPGLRLPGAFDGFELATRAILGQQVTVKAATTLAGRLVAALGDAVDTPFPGLDRLSPTPERIAAATPEDLASVGLPLARAGALVALARAVADGRLALDAGADPERTMRELHELPGVGPWTVSYIAMRALSWPDAFPKEDVAIRRALGGATPAAAEDVSQAWRPWRGYAVMHLWHDAADRGRDVTPGATRRPAARPSPAAGSL